MNQPMTNNKPQDLWPAVIRALIGRCPNCGNGRLFATYLQQVESCAACGERLGDIPAADGPAWLTILLIGMVLAPLLLSIGPDTTWPVWETMIAFLSLTIVLALVILPRAKGLFIAIIWHMRCTESPD
jgi:uncharacterized protein (DUF983 family)